MSYGENELLPRAFLDGELDARHACDVEAGLDGCPRRATHLAWYREMQRAIAAAAPRLTVAASSRRRIETALPRSIRAILKRFVVGSALSAAMAATLVVAVFRPDPDQRVLGNVVSAHGRSLSVLSGAPRQQDDVAGLPMRFSLHQEGPASSCAPGCRLLISARGMITADTPRDFDNFVHNRDVHGATVVLDSKGGSVLGAIAFGRAIRGLGLATMLGRVREQTGREGAVRRASVSPHAECQSMCPFVLLGGVRRYIPPEARVLVHQIWLGDRRDDAAAASYSAEDLVLVQRDIGRLVQYTLDMGGGAELLQVALRIPPWEPMRMLSRDELRRTRLDTSQDGIGQTPVAPASSSSSSDTDAPAAATDGARSETNNPLGWELAKRGGGVALVRQHPLTVEGERIGTFQLALGCAPGRGTYTVTYVETRHSPNGRDDATVKQVDLWIEGKAASLDLVSSRLNAKPRQLETLANGSVPADLLQSFADAAGDSMSVRTMSATEPGTLIRMGNSGFARALPRLAAACAPARVETHAELEGAVNIRTGKLTFFDNVLPSVPSM